MPARMLLYRFFAKTYGFTEKQVKEDLSLDTYEWYPRIEEAEARAAEILQKQAQRDAKREQHRGGGFF